MSKKTVRNKISRDNEIVKITYAFISIIITLICGNFIIHVEPPAPLWMVVVIGLILTLGLPTFLFLLNPGIMWLLDGFIKGFRPDYKVGFYEINISTSLILVSFYLPYILTQTNNLWIIILTILFAFIGTYILLTLSLYITNPSLSTDVEFDACDIRLRSNEETHRFHPHEPPREDE